MVNNLSLVGGFNPQLNNIQSKWESSPNRGENKEIPSGKLTWQWKMDLLKMYSLLKMGIFHCYVRLPECNRETTTQLNKAGYLLGFPGTVLKPLLGKSQLCHRQWIGLIHHLGAEQRTARVVDQLPWHFHIIGDGHQPNTRGLYTHYKDSLLKVGWDKLPNKTRQPWPLTKLKIGQARKLTNGWFGGWWFGIRIPNYP